MSTNRVDFRAIPVNPSGEEPVENERRFRASVEGAFSTADSIMMRLSRQGGDYNSNIDGGAADSIYGGIIAKVDGGNASGTTNPAP